MWKKIYIEYGYLPHLSTVQQIDNCEIFNVHHTSFIHVSRDISKSKYNRLAFRYYILFTFDAMNVFVDVCHFEATVMTAFERGSFGIVTSRDSKRLEVDYYIYLRTF